MPPKDNKGRGGSRTSASTSTRRGDVLFRSSPTISRSNTTLSYSNTTLSYSNATLSYSNRISTVRASSNRGRSNTLGGGK